ncbi:hypothetical protein ILUMI_12536 [Ignelater luminosus]|uniref:Uncharacterized protein n=1 Tax=Ignelater luminosus TaxID=2038154 RepID=A0A8K0D2M3_IGNLU|nr:hypothetical protein ILUMI_12536 [Ignelater luminosus]
MENCIFEEIKPDDEIGKIIEDEMLSEFCTKYIMVGQDRTVFGDFYLQYAEEIKNFEVYDDDVWVVSFPKAGKQKIHSIELFLFMSLFRYNLDSEMVWMIANNLDFEGAKQPLKERFPFLEYRQNFSKNKMENCIFEEIKPDDEIGKIIEDEMLSEFCTKYIMVGQDRTVFGDFYLQYAEEIKNFEVYDDDVWIVSFPKAGKQKIHTIELFLFMSLFRYNLDSEMVWMIANNLDFEGAKQPLKERFPFLETVGIVGKYKEELSPETITKFNEWIKCYR